MELNYVSCTVIFLAVLGFGSKTHGEDESTQGGGVFPSGYTSEVIKVKTFPLVVLDSGRDNFKKLCEELPFRADAKFEQTKLADARAWCEELGGQRIRHFQLGMEAPKRFSSKFCGDWKEVADGVYDPGCRYISCQNNNGPANTYMGSAVTTVSSVFSFLVTCYK